METIEGLNGIKATVLAYSIGQTGEKFISWEIEYPRLVLAELNTHRQLSRNSFSSRAVPFLKMLEQLTGAPVRFGANQAGMQDKGEDHNEAVWLDVLDEESGNINTIPFPPKQAWNVVKEAIIKLAKPFYEAGYHKQVYNRLMEAFQMQKSVVSATETDNFFWLRDDDAADPTLHELARVMKQAMDQATPEHLQPGEWHLPYIDIVKTPSGRVYGIKVEDEHGVHHIPLSLDEAIKVSCARCAAVSYRNEGYGLKKSIEVYDRLVGSARKHASAFEHCATPMEEAHMDEGPEGNGVNLSFVPHTWEPGITHVDRDGNLWSGNLKGWIQYRKLIPGECYTTS